MRSPRRPALALIGACALSLAFAAPAKAGDRATDPVGDGPRPGLDIIAVTTTVTEVAITFEVDLAGEWTYEEGGQLLLSIGTDSQSCGMWGANYHIVLDGSGIAEQSSFAKSVGLAVDGPHVSMAVPLDGMRDPETIWFQVMTQDWTVAADDPREGIDVFPDAASDLEWDVSCRQIAVVTDVRSSSPSPPGAPEPATTGSGAGPWLTVLPVTLLLAVAGLLLYDWLVAEHRWHRRIGRR